jgi:hypothetical protein
MKKPLTPEQIKMFKQVTGIDDITIRDKCAMAALSAYPELLTQSAHTVASNCYEIADEMVKLHKK